MKEFREQLAARFGQPVPPSPAADDSLGPQAHHASARLTLLTTLGPSVGHPVKRDASLSTTRQVTDRTLRALKASRKCERGALNRARSDDLKKQRKRVGLLGRATSPPHRTSLTTKYAA